MKTTSSAEAFLKSVRETLFPEGSGKSKSGACVPNGNIVEFTATMKRMWNAPLLLSNGKSPKDPRPRAASFSAVISAAFDPRSTA